MKCDAGRSIRATWDGQDDKNGGGSGIVVSFVETQSWTTVTLDLRNAVETEKNEAGCWDVVRVAEAMLEKQTLHFRLLSMWCWENEAVCI